MTYINLIYLKIFNRENMVYCKKKWKRWAFPNFILRLSNYLRLQISQNCSNEFQSYSLLLRAFEIKWKVIVSFGFEIADRYLPGGPQAPPPLPTPSSLFRVNKQGLAIIAQVDFRNPKIITDLPKPKNYLYLFS